MALAVRDVEAVVPLSVVPVARPAPVLPSPLWTLHVKRVAEGSLALALLVLLAPLMLLIAVLVKVTSPGPVLFKQVRVGKDCRHFRMWKFRTMVTDTTKRIMADPELRQIYESNGFKLPRGYGDRFLTPIGRFLRRTSLDELPQLCHVVAGTMSLVGIRPIEPAELSRRPRVDRTAYVALRPGLTGLWQVNGRSTLTYDERCDLDHQYVITWSVVRDLGILARTPRAVLRTGDTL